MTIEQIDFLPLQPIRVRSNGKRDYDPAAKQRLVQMCVSSGTSVSSMALKAGVNANHAAAMYVFRNRRADRIKILLWDCNGFWLLFKRLEKDRFAWPRAVAVATLTVEQLHWLLEGIDIEAVRRHPERAYHRAA